MPARPFLWIFSRIQAIQPDVDRPSQLIDFCKKQKEIGYNGLLLWDSDLSKPQIPDYARRNYSLFSEWCASNGWSFGIQTFPQGSQLRQWPGTDARILEKNGQYLCLADPRVHPIYEQIVDNILELFPAGSPLACLMAYYDEIRQQGTHSVCRRPGGELLAEHAQKTMQIVRDRAPHLVPAVWNDMFDPNHNAITPYSDYPVHGGWSGSWNGIASDVLVMDWMTPNRDTSEDDSFISFKWWAARGNPQLYMGYYDGASGDGTTAAKERDYIRNRVQALPSQVGYCYTTWTGNLSRTKEYLTAEGWATLGDTPTPPAQKTCPTCNGTGKVDA